MYNVTVSPIWYLREVVVGTVFWNLQARPTLLATGFLSPKPKHVSLKPPVLGEQSDLAENDEGFPAPALVLAVRSPLTTYVE